MKVIAFSGKKQSGKTTAVKGLTKAMMPLTMSEINLADALKDLVWRYMISPLQSEGCGCDWDRIYPDKFGEEAIKNVPHPCGKTIREILQIVGTDWFRGMWPNIWIGNYVSAVSDAPDGDIILTSDVRFPNEVRCIQDLGGHVIRLLRAPLKDEHESETALDWLDGQYFNPPTTEIAKKLYEELSFDAFVDNREMSIKEQNEAIWKLVNERGWL